MKRILIFLLILVVLALSAWFVIKRYYLFDLVHAKIEESIHQQIENDFKFTLDKFRISWIASKAHLKGFTLLVLNETDTVAYFKGDISIDILGWKNSLFDQKKIIKSIELKKADFYYSADHPLIMKNKDSTSDQEIEIKQVKAAGKLIFANNHQMQHGRLVSQFNVSVDFNYNNKTELRVEELVNQITQFRLSNIHYLLPDGFYQLRIAEAGFTLFENISIKQVVITPIDSRRVFANKKKIATDYISLTIDSVQLLTLDNRLNERIYINQIQIHQPSIDVFKDKNYPANTEYKAILVDLLHEINTPLYIASVDISNMFIKYTELSEGAKEAGDLFFSEANATIKNITNVPDSLLIYNQLLIHAEAKFYGAGFLKTNMSYELASKTGQFRIKGSLSPMEIGKANAIVSKLVPVKIKSGQIDKLRFNFSGTRTHSHGNLWFEYTDLNVELMEVNYWNTNFTRKVLSSIGNRVLRNSNPAGNGTFRIGAIQQERDTTKSMFHYWWFSLQSGFASTLGITPAKQEINYKSGLDATFLDKMGLGEK